MSIADLIRAMSAAGAPPEAIALAVDAIELGQAKDEDRRARQAERKRKSRAGRDGHGTVTGQSQPTTVTVTGQSQDIPSPLPSLSPEPPNPPIPAPVVIPQSPSGSRPKPESRFPEFWSAYPKRRGTNSRHEANLKFDRLVAVGADQAAIIAGAKAYGRSMADSDPQFVKQATSWLNARLWEDYLPKSEQPQLFGGKPDAAEADPIVELPGGLRWPESRIKAQLAAYRDNPRSWIDMIGPPPGHPGCRIPKHLLEQARAA